MAWIDDDVAYAKYPGAHWVYNKLTLAEKLEYVCGPAGIKVPKAGEYIIRPMMNLAGMGANAKIIEVAKGKVPTWEPGYFWCEAFTGRHITADFVFRKGEMFCTFVAEGWNDRNNLVKFTKWKKLDELPEECHIPNLIESACNPNHFNLEFVDGKIIECHLRHGNQNFPEKATEIIPVWSDADEMFHATWSEAGYSFKPDDQDAMGNLTEFKRIGFYYK